MTAFGKDRPGIVADVTSVLYETGCNLEDSTMSMLS
ncbi:MAG: amino acid-binding protein, partial [Desulfuromonadales bacterium]|nr:amino acid-binding protein [Desulfuromonadales bacterium]